MKITVVFFGILSCIILASCNDTSTKELCLTKHGKSVQREVFKNLPDTIQVNRTSLIIKVVDKNNINIKNCQVYLRLEGLFSGHKTDTNWVLPDKGEVAVNICSKNSLVTLNITNGTTVNLCDTFSRNFDDKTRIVYVLKNCNQP